jgi:glycosyltransferase involved in cell wall biosynthesis
MTILYIAFARPKYSIDGVYIKGLRDNNVTVKVYSFEERGFRRLVKVATAFWHNKKKTDLIVAGFATPQAVILLRLLTGKKIIYNALCSEYERKIVSRQLAKPISFKAFYYWLLDYLASHSAWLVMLETEEQIDYYCKLVKMRRKKALMAPLGVNDEIFSYSPNLAKFKQFTVVFRGRLLPESGAEYVVRAAKKLDKERVKFIMLVAGMGLTKLKSLMADLKPKNLQLIADRLSDQEMTELMQKCHLSLGQLSDHSRLSRTIPHKAYESLALKLPYLTARNSAVMKVLKENKTCLACNPADDADLAAKILWAKSNSKKLNDIGQTGYNFYFKNLTPKKLAQNILLNL